MGIITEYFKQLVFENAAKKGMPNLRFAFVKSPVWGKTAEQLQKDVIEGTDPVTGKPVMQEIVDELTRPLRAEDTATRTIPQSAGPDHFGPDTAENLQRAFREKGMTILLVEQNVRQALEIADRAYVLENGRTVLEGESKGLLGNDHVKKAYLGL